MAATCINLKKRFPEYKITLDPAAEDAKDPWYYQISGKLGTIYPYGKNLLAVEIDHHKYTVPQLTALGLEHSQHGDNEHTFLFGLLDFNRIAAIVGSRKKRKVSPEQRAKLSARLEKARAAIRG